MREPTAGDPATAARPAPGGAGVIVAVLAFSGITVSLMQTLIIPIIPLLPGFLSASPADAAWAVTATLLASAVAVPSAGRLGDMYGKRRMVLISVALMVLGSLIGALTSTLWVMVLARVLQGAAAGVIPLGISILRDALPAEKLAGAVGVMSASLGVGGALGMPIAAAIAEWADWHMLFWVSVILGIVSGLLILVFVPESDLRSGGSFDGVGAAGLSIALIALLLSISKGADWGWTSAPTLIGFLVAAVVLPIWGTHQLRTHDPLVDLRVSAGRQVLLTNIASVVFGFAMFAQSLVIPQVVQLPKEAGLGLDSTILMAGLVMAPGGLVMMVAASASAKLTNRYGPKITLMLGAVVVGGAYGVGAFTMHSIWQIIVITSVTSGGIGLAYAAMPALIMGAVPESQTGAANALNTLMRSLGTSFASAIAGVVLATMTVRLGPAELPSETGFQVVMLAAAGSSLAALLIAAALPRRRGVGGRAPTPAEAEPVPARD